MFSMTALSHLTSPHSLEADIDSTAFVGFDGIGIGQEMDRIERQALLDHSLSFPLCIALSLYHGIAAALFGVAWCCFPWRLGWLELADASDVNWPSSRSMSL